VASVPGIERVRLSSASVRAFTPGVLDALRDPVFCPHWHIPLQSGSDRVLERMRRDHRLDDFRRLVAALRRRGDEPAFSTDVIAGHPGEDEAAFAETIAACRELGFAKIHVFPYSRREGTLAAKLPGHVEPLEVRRRARLLGELDRELGLAHRERRVGAVLDDVLVEGLPAARAAGEDGSGLPLELEGFTRRYEKVRFPAPGPQAALRFPGTVQPVRVARAEPALLLGEWAGALASAAS
jgi:threonylcarbamoyladenosine tRNA methylthiotransferase MtaB